MNVVKQLVLILVLICLAATAASAEIVIVTKPLSDLNGDVWPREYFGVSHSLFEIPQGVTIDAGINPSSIRPNVTRLTNTIHGHTEVLDAWVNVIDVANKRYYAGNLGKWFDLDSTELIQIRPGFDTCAVYFRSCARIGAPPDSCRTVRAMLYKSLSMSDIAFIIFTSYDGLDQLDRSISAKSGDYFRKLLGYLAREVALEKVVDSSSAGNGSWLAGCSCIDNFKANSIRRVEYMSELKKE